TNGGRRQASAAGVGTAMVFETTWNGVGNGRNCRSSGCSGPTELSAPNGEVVVTLCFTYPGARLLFPGPSAISAIRARIGHNESRATTTTGPVGPARALKVPLGHSAGQPGTTRGAQKDAPTRSDRPCQAA